MQVADVVVRHVRIVAWLLCVAVVTSSSAHASPCVAREDAKGELSPGFLQGPLQLGFAQADAGMFESACPRNDVGMGVTARALVDIPASYANFQAAWVLDTSIMLTRRIRVFAHTQLLNEEAVVSLLRANALGLGDTSAGLSILAVEHDRWALSVFTRATLPTAVFHYQNAWPFALDAGIVAELAPHAPVRVHGGLLGTSSWAISSADPRLRAGFATNIGLTVVPLNWLALVADIDTQILAHAPLDHLAVGGGVRVGIDDVGVELGVLAPVAGAERNVASVRLRASVRW
jgi:hypothetical protein